MDSMDVRMPNPTVVLTVTHVKVQFLQRQQHVQHLFIGECRHGMNAIDFIQQTVQESPPCSARDLASYANDRCLKLLVHRKNIISTMCKMLIQSRAKTIDVTLKRRTVVEV
jgi:hypothetical protein